MNMTRDEALRKATALLRLAARGGTVGESAAAAARAQDLMDRFELTKEVVEELDGKPREAEEDVVDFADKPEGFIDTKKSLVYWRWYLASGIARLHGCYVWTSRRGDGRAFEVVGRPNQVETVRYMFSWLAIEVERLAKLHGCGLGVVWRREFSEGAANELNKRLRDQRDATVNSIKREYSTNPHALMLVSRSLARMEDIEGARSLVARKRNIRPGGGRNPYTQNNHTAKTAGAAAARSINLNRPSKVIGVGR
jgi:hypothetical protein